MIRNLTIALCLFAMSCAAMAQPKKDYWDTLWVIDADNSPTSFTVDYDFIDTIVRAIDDGTTVSIDLGQFDFSNTVMSTTTNTAHMIIRPYAGKNAAIQVSGGGVIEIDGATNISGNVDASGYSITAEDFIADGALTVGGNTTVSGSIFRGDVGLNIGASGSPFANFFGTNGDFTNEIDTPEVRPNTVGGAVWILDDDSSAGASGVGVVEGGHVQIAGGVQSDVKPQADSLYDLGTTALRWAEVWVDATTITNVLSVGASVVPATDNTGELGTTALTWDDVRAGTATVTTMAASGAVTGASVTATGAASGGTVYATDGSDYIYLWPNTTAQLDTIGATVNSGGMTQDSGVLKLGSPATLQIDYNTRGLTSTRNFEVKHDGSTVFTITGGDTVGNATFTGTLNAPSVNVGGGYGATGATIQSDGDIFTNKDIAADGALIVGGSTSLGDGPTDVVTIEGSDTRWITDRTGNYAGKYVVSDRISNAGATDVYTLAQPVAGDCSGQFTVRVNGVFDTAADNGEQYYLISNHYYSNSDAGVEAGALGAATTAGTALTVTVDSTGTSFRVTVAENVASGNVDYIVTIEYQWTVPYT